MVWGLPRGVWVLITTGESIPLLCVEGVPGLPGAPQDDAGLTRKFEMSHVAEELYKKEFHDPDNHDGVIINLDQTS